MVHERANRFRPSSNSFPSSRACHSSLFLFHEDRVNAHIYINPNCFPRTCRFQFPRTSCHHLQYLHRHSGNGPICFGYPWSCNASFWEFGNFPTRTHLPITFTTSSRASKLHRYVVQTAPRANPIIPDKSLVRVETMMSQTISAPSLVVRNRPVCINSSLPPPRKGRVVNGHTTKASTKRVPPLLISKSPQRFVLKRTNQLVVVC